MGELKELKKELSKLSGENFFNPKYRDVFKKYFPNEESEATEEVAEEKETETTTDVATDNVENKEVEKASETETAEETAEEKDEVAEEPLSVETTPEVSEVVAEKVESAEEKPADSKELLETKLELELVKAGVREDRIEAAKRLFMPEIQSIADFAKIKGLIEQYPEWLKQETNQAQPFGMPVSNSDSLTAEERKLLAMGINPRD